MFALMILVGISDLRVCCVCTMYYTLFAHCNLGLLMESCNFDICI